ncbi:MAG TPA: DNA repair protein RecO, partial [Gemmatimonadaceae bacterium]|nr:DNA repair protein RecO [Gemmatimonadaceae bacterium]
MTLLATDAVVLHLFDYRETSRIVRLVTRDAGLVSVVARGARRPKNRFGAALDLFASGVAQVALHATGDLHGLNAFDAVHSRATIAASLDRFGAANAVAELCLRFGQGHESAEVFAAAVRALDAIAVAEGGRVHASALGAAWRLVAAFGFTPALEQCAACHEAIAPEADVTFHHRAGGALCARCARNA